MFLSFEFRRNSVIWIIASFLTVTTTLVTSFVNIRFSDEPSFIFTLGRIILGKYSSKRLLKEMFLEHLSALGLLLYLQEYLSRLKLKEGKRKEGRKEDFGLISGG